MQLTEFRLVTDNELYRLLYDSTISDVENDTRYTNYIDIIQKGDAISRYELYTKLLLDQRTPFLDYDQYTNKQVNLRLEWIIKGEVVSC